MKLTKSLFLLFSSTALLGMYGCGSANRESNIDALTPAAQASAACIACHNSDNYKSSVTGVRVVTEWQNSVHNTKSGASCGDCHKPNGHPNGGTVIKGADMSDVTCLECHGAGKIKPLDTAHFSAFSNLTSAQYVSALDPSTKQCRVCHNPHDTTSVMQVNRDWAASAHADTKFIPGDATNSGVWSHYFWTGASRESCARCHTSSGYVKYTTPGSVAPFGTTNTRNEVLGCKSCHVDYSWKRRTVAAVTSPGYTNLPTPSPIQYPDAGESNLCLHCHVGRAAGQSIALSTGNFANLSFINSHYLTAGGVVYGKTGYEYATRSYVAPVFYKHDTVGGTGSGPCVGCHMTNTQNHRFMPVTKDANDVITAVISTSCANTAGCHTAGSGFEMTPAKLEEEKKGLTAATDTLKALLAVRNIFYANSNPYFFKTATDTSSANATKDWTVGGTLVGKDVMGAAFNLNMIAHDPGSYAHNRFYSKRLLYDAIDYMSNGALDNDVEVAINGLAALTPTQKADAITYLLGGPGGTRP